MKKIALLFAFALLLGSSSLFGQARSQLNFGFIGLSYDIPVAENVSIAPFFRTNIDLNIGVAGVKADYYFDNLLGLPEQWDFYAGANAGYRLWRNNDNWGTEDFDIGLEVGGRYFWNDKWGILVEASGGNNFGGMLGLTMRL